MKPTDKDQANLKKILLFQKAKPGATVKEAIKSCKLGLYDYTRLRRLGLVPHRGNLKEENLNYAKITAAESVSSDGKLVLVMGSPTQISEFLRSTL